MDTAGGHRLIRVNQAALCADPGAGRVVSREAGAPRACLWLSLSPPSPFIIGPPINTPGSRGGHRQGEGRGGGGGGGGATALSFSVQVEPQRRRQTWIDKKKGEGGKNKNKGQRVEERGGGVPRVTD